MSFKDLREHITIESVSKNSDFVNSKKIGRPKKEIKRNNKISIYLSDEEVGLIKEKIMNEFTSDNLSFCLRSIVLEYLKRD